MMKLKPFYLTIILSLIFFSCEEKLFEEIVSTFPNGQIEKIWLKNSSGIIKGEKLFYENGSVRMQGGLNKHGEREGLWQAFFEDKTLWSECEYQNGQRHGINRVYYPNGQLRYKGQWENEKKIGLWTVFDEKGELIESKEF